jgi:hypothetical protein
LEGTQAYQQQNSEGRNQDANTWQIAFHGTPNIPANWDGRAAHTNRDSTTRLPENKFNSLLCYIEQFDEPAGLRCVW